MTTTMHNGPGVMGRKTRPPLSEQNKQQILKLRGEGLLATEIALATGLTYQSVTKFLRDVGMNAGNGAKRSSPVTAPGTITPVTVEDQVLNERAGQTEELKQRYLEKVTTASIPLAPIAKDEDEAKERTTILGHEILRGAERLIRSINSMSDEALAMATLHHKATALGILVDKLRVLNNKANPMFGAPNDNTTINIVNIIASAAPPRKKDAAPTLVIPNPGDEDAVIIQPKTAGQILKDEEVAKDKFDGF